MCQLRRFTHSIRSRWLVLTTITMTALVSVITYQLLIALPEAEPPVIQTSEQTVYFPQMESSGHDVSPVDVRGPLVLDDAGCLRLSGSEGQVIIWPHNGYDVDLIDGLVALVDEDTRQPIAFEGDWIKLAGIVGFRDVERTMGRQLRDACDAADRYVIAGDLQPDGISRVSPEAPLTVHYEFELGYEPRAWFLQREAGVGHTLDGDRSGELVLDANGCLRLDDEGGPLLIWPASGVELEWFGPDVMLERISTGETIAEVGDTVHVGGKAHLADDIDDLVQGGLPDACKNGDLWMTGPLYEIERLSWR
ncbi:MAG: hypothetical protein EA415_03665 [Sphaerobacteraceae bacterium]|nr:MAG: hypothetical protein EA415_03665 [Sphaerobacteraceae bacterium]